MKIAAGAVKQKMRAAVLVALAALAVSTVWGQTGRDLPDSLKPPGNQRLVMTGHATGAQIYECQLAPGDAAGGDIAGKWVLAGPEAQLLDDQGQKIADHYAGPTWQATDGSKVKGKVLAQASPTADTIPWLLLTAVAHDGDGVMSGITSIQRLNTSGGSAPTTDCDAANKGDKVRVNYSADYYFYTPVR